MLMCTFVFLCLQSRSVWGLPCPSQSGKVPFLELQPPSVTTTLGWGGYLEVLPFVRRC